jgi:hypothetical protein
MSKSNIPIPAWLRPGPALAAAGLVALLAACGGSGSPAPAGNTGTPGAAGSSAPAGGTSQAPVPAESNPPGDIPDTTVYVPYQSAAGHLLLKVPEGWSRQAAPATSTFSSNLNSISVAWMSLAAAPTVSSVRATTVPALQASALAFRLQAVRAVSLAAGRQYRLVIERFELYRNGRAAVVALSSAVGSDNVDPWRIVSQSFRWM